MFDLGLQLRGQTGPIQPKIEGHLEKKGPSHKQAMKLIKVDYINACIFTSVQEKFTSASMI